MKLAIRPCTPLRCACFSCSILVLAGCSRAPSPTVELSPATPIPVPAPRATPEPIALVIPEPNYFAPEGVFFLTASKSIETEHGIERLIPGTRLLRQPNGTYKDPKGRMITLATHEVTNDMRVAWDVSRTDAATQRNIRSQLATSEAEPKVYKTASTPAAIRPSRTYSRPAAATPANPLERGAHTRLKAK